jgi:hypothetical protein
MDSSNDASETAAWIAMSALAALLLLDLAMFTSMLAGVSPHAPGERGPFIAAVAALALADLVLIAGRKRVAGGWAALLTALACIPGVGPHKFWTEPAASALAPVIVLGTAGVLALAWAGLAMLRETGAHR